MERLSYDRGTLLLKGLDAPSPDMVPSTAPPHCVWDPRVQRYRAYAEIARWVKHVTGANNAVFARRARTDLWRAPELRDSQHAALVSWVAAGRRGLVVLPTGAGKTRLACAAMAAARCAALVLVPTRVLLHQWRAEIARHYGGSVGCLGDGEQRVEHVTVATFEGAYQRMAKLGDHAALEISEPFALFGRTRIYARALTSLVPRLSWCHTPRLEG